MNPISNKNLTAGALLFADLLLLIAPHRAYGQPRPAGSPSNIECLERLEVPDYPPLPRTASIQAVQTVKVHLSDQATVQNVESSLQGKVINLEKDFKDAAQKSSRTPDFRKPAAERPLRWSSTTRCEMTLTSRPFSLSGHRIIFGYGTDLCMQIRQGRSSEFGRGRTP